MNYDEIELEALWAYYQRGYHCMLCSGRYFRQILRPALSHVFFLKAMPLLREYARANRGLGELPPGFGDQLATCALSARDLLHLDYAISLGFVDAQGVNPQQLSSAPMPAWPGPGSNTGVFVAADALFVSDIEDMMQDFMDEGASDEEPGGEEDREPDPPFDL